MNGPRDLQHQSGNRFQIQFTGGSNNFGPAPQLPLHLAKENHYMNLLENPMGNICPHFMEYLFILQG